MSSRSNDIQPKSMTTVVVDLLGVATTSSRLTLACVITTSVVNRTISNTEPTNVVLPTPNPPATTIFAEMVARAVPLELPKSTEHPLKQCHVWLSARGLVTAGLVDRDQACL